MQRGTPSAGEVFCASCQHVHARLQVGMYEAGQARTCTRTHARARASASASAHTGKASRPTHPHATHNTPAIQYRSFLTMAPLSADCLTPASARAEGCAPSSPMGPHPAAYATAVSGGSHGGLSHSSSQEQRDPSVRGGIGGGRGTPPPAPSWAQSSLFQPLPIGGGGGGAGGGGGSGGGGGGATFRQQALAAAGGSSLLPGHAPPSHRASLDAPASGPGFAAAMTAALQPY